MTEYWKSNTRKFCDFCKCWLAENQVSISFHESGKRHKENVKKHISSLSKKSVKEQKQKAKIDSDMKKMEQAALEAYAKDIQNNADITSQEINDMLGKGSSTSEIKIKPEPPSWHECKTDDGKIYFWNVQTNETMWDPPDNYLSLAEQDLQQRIDRVQEKDMEKIKQFKNLQKQKDVLAEVNAKLAREKNKKRAAKPLPKPQTTCGPAPRAHTYGAWKPIPEKTEDEVDLQLPTVVKKLPDLPAVLEPEVVKFKERTVESLGEGPVDFKKRKLNSTKRNIRQKLDDD